jgi:hypothetical protein
MVEQGGGLAPPVDFEALVRHAIDLSDDLEQAWSDALDRTAIANVDDDLNAKLGALASALAAAVTEVEGSLSAAGIDPKLYTWPGDPNAFKTLQRATDLKARREQLELAQMVTLRRLLEVFQGLTKPTGTRIDLRTQARSEWFEAGAFSLVKDQAVLFLRITREVDRVSDELLRRNRDAPILDLSIEDAFESLRLMRRAHARGDLDAALLHARAAMRELVASLPFISREDPRLRRPGLLLAQVPSLSEYADSLILLEEEAADLESRTGELGVCTVLLEGLMPVIAKLAHELPITELNAMVGEGEAG